MAETRNGALAWLLEPVAEAQPCGPDLEAEGAQDFLDYYYEAEARLPERYFVPGVSGVAGSMVQVFDPKSIDLRAETQQITALLRQSRDLRLLSLLARFQILAGRPADFAETLEVMAALLTAWPEAVNPPLGGATAERRAALEELGSIKTVVMPLQYLPLAGHADVTYRRWLVATGQAAARPSEEGTERGPIISALSASSYQRQVERLHDDLGRAALSLSRIADLSAAQPAGRFRPAFGETLATLTGMQQLLHEAWPALVIWSNLAEAAPATAPESPQDDAPATPPQGGPAPLAVLPAAGAITTRAGVRAALEGAERFLARNEPSSPALILVTQARLLIGRPLIEALETLLPADAGKAVIGFAPETGFAMSMERMKKLSDSALGGFDQAASEAEEGPAPEPLRLTSRAEVAGQLHAVEAFYAAREPASPIPILLARARTFMDKGFQAIVAELLPKSEPKG